MFDGFRNFGSEQQRGSNGASSSNGGSSSTSRGKKRTLEELFKPPLDIMFKGDLQVRYFMRFLFTLEGFGIRSPDLFVPYPEYCYFM